MQIFSLKKDKEEKTEEQTEVKENNIDIFTSLVKNMDEKDITEFLKQAGIKEENIKIILNELNKNSSSDKKEDE